MSAKKTAVPELIWQCRIAGLPSPEEEVRFHPPRKWRADLLFRDARLIVEVEGGVFVQGRHTRGQAFEEDCVKYASAMVLGYRVLRVTTRHVQNGLALQWIEQLLAARAA